MNDELRTEQWGNQEGEILPTADLAIVICSLNGEAGVHRCLDVLSRQTPSVHVAGLGEMP